MNHLSYVNGSSSLLSDSRVSANEDGSGGGGAANNSNNRSSSSSSCKYTGVRKRKWGKWVTEIRLPNSRERIWLGSYDTAEKAARAFDAAQFCLRGKSANFNFPDDPPDIPGGRSMSRQEIQEAAARYANLDAASQSQDREETEEECGNRVESDSMIIDHSPTLSQETFQMDNSERSFHEQLSLSATFGSGNYVSEYGYFTGFDYMASDYQMTPQPETFDYMTSDYHHNTSHPETYSYNAEDTYDNSVYQHSYLWNF